MTIKTLEKRCEEAGDFEPIKALALARKYDWANWAYVDENNMLCGLEDEQWLPDEQRLHTRKVCIPATREAVEAFAEGQVFAIR